MGFGLEEAQTLWGDEGFVEFVDPDHVGEERFIRVGYSHKKRILLVVFCERLGGNIVRLISALLPNNMRKEYNLLYESK